MDNDKLYNFLDKIYTELQTHSKNLDNTDCKFDAIEKELKKNNKKIDDAIRIKKRNAYYIR